MEEKYYLYWIHRDCHTSVKTEGYVGITKDYKNRFRVHRYDAKHKNSYHLHHALNKYDNISFDIICVGTMSNILDLEFKLRPREHIGWNILRGGATPRTGVTESAETTRKKAEAVTVLTRCNHLIIYGLRYIKNYSLNKIAENFSCTSETIRKSLLPNGICYPELESYKDRIRCMKNPQPFSYKGVTEESYNQIMDDYEAGMLIKHIATKYKKHRCVIRRIYQAESKYIKIFEERRKT